MYAKQYRPYEMPCSTASDLGLVCVEILWPSQPNGVMSSVVNLYAHAFTGQD